MGGDHKCPVCQATFTRPQHVARHMRSHTGDRPYKCQYCGDQFARSDLLSRHVNKCHANEKPLPNAGSARRKGTVSATRATTSKQACDQCVQSSLPCDGCNPCSKCVSRKCRCTYVKFHRQTAPIGPGHNARPTAPADSASLPSSAFSNGGPSSRLPLYQPSDDEFVLAPAPGSVPTMADTLYTSNSFSFPPLYPHTDINVIQDNLDYGAKYRTQQAEFLGPERSGMGTGLTPLYDPRHGTSAPNPSWLGGWESQDPQDVFHHSQHQGPRQTELVPNHGPSSAMHDKHELGTHPAAPNFGHQQNLDNPPIPMAMPYPPFALSRSHTSSRQHGQGRNSSNSYDSSNSNSRRGSVDFSGSDGASGASGSIPCSANNSNVHLPLANAEVSSLGYGNTGYNLASSIPDRTATSSASSNSSHHGRYDSHHDRQEFSSAFGLMSLDDPAVIAGLAVDGQPFFDDPAQEHNQQESTDPERNHDGLLTTDVGPDIDTPMPLKRDAPRLPSIIQRPATSSGAPEASSGGGSFGTTFGNLPTPSRDTDSRELREFWRQYMRTPLSGPQDATGNIPGPSMINSKNPSPTSHRRQRVASLPSAKTPMVERDDMFAHHSPAFGYPANQPDQRGREKAATVVQQGPTSSLRTTLHVKEDLRSYEAAVMARKAPTLNLQLKRPTKGKSVFCSNQQGQSARAEVRNIKLSQSSDASPQMGYGSLPQSASGAPQPSLTLANAFGEHGNNIFSLASSRSMGGKEESVSPSLSSSRDTSVDACSASTSSDVELRPAFKRLASQTLGPENSKRAFFGYNADEVDERDKMTGWSSTVPEVKRQLNGFDGALNTGTHPERPVASIAERRRRRMSAPSSSVEKVNVSQEGSQHSQPSDAAHTTSVRLGYAPGARGGIAG